MIITLYQQQRNELYNQFVYNHPHWKHNKERIDYVLHKVYKKLITYFNKYEDKVRLHIRKNTNKAIDILKFIPILSEGGKIEHLYIADIVVDNIIIEVDGKLHEKQKEWDEERDRLTSLEGYKTIRIPAANLSKETIDSYLKGIIY